MAPPRTTRVEFDPKTNTTVTITALGEVIRRPAWTNAQALEEFKYAVRTWMSCMDQATRGEAVAYADEMMFKVPFFPKSKGV